MPPPTNSTPPHPNLVHPILPSPPTSILPHITLPHPSPRSPASRAPPPASSPLSPALPCPLWYTFSPPHTPPHPTNTQRHPTTSCPSIPTQPTHVSSARNLPIVSPHPICTPTPSHFSFHPILSITLALAQAPLEWEDSPGCVVVTAGRRLKMILQVVDANGQRATAVKAVELGSKVAAQEKLQMESLQ